MLNKAKLEFLLIQQQIASFATLSVSTDGRNKETSSLILPPARCRLCGTSQENVTAITILRSNRPGLFWEFPQARHCEPKA
jgi:hypothetical protein